MIDPKSTFAGEEELRNIDPDVTLLGESGMGFGENITVTLRVMQDGRVIHEEEGHSLLPSLLYNINGSAFGRTIPVASADDVRVCAVYDSSVPDYFDDDPFDDDGLRQWHQTGGLNPLASISGISGSNPITVNLGNNLTRDGNDIGDIDVICISNVRGNNNLAGRHTTFTVVDNNTIEIPVSSTGSEDISSATLVPGFLSSKARDPFEGNSLQRAKWFDRLDMYLGRDGSANDLEDFWLRDMIRPGSNAGQLQYNPLTVNEPVINLTQQISTITVTREVQNNTGNPIDVKEIGFASIMGGVDNLTVSTFPEGYQWYFFSRDPISTVTINDGSTVSFQYSIRTSSQDSGGIMTNFNEMLYRHMANTNRTVKDVNNVDQDDGPSTNQWRTIPRAGVAEFANRDGVVVGTSGQVVDEANVSLINEIQQGQNDGELFRSGGYVDALVRDDANDRFYFDLVSIFENRGSTNIEAREIGYYTNGPSGLVMIARSQVDPSQTISPGDVVEARYRISLNL